MPIDPVKMALAVHSGLSTVCATCERYWEGRDHGLPGDKCTSKTACASPLGGGDFHEYKGPIAAFDQWCFICGENPVGVVSKPGSARRFGVCSRHAKQLSSLRSVSTALPNEQKALVNIGGTTKRVSELPQRKPTLREVIAETEREWAAAAKEQE